MDLVHYWIVDVDLTETLSSKEENRKRDALNDELIGTMVHAPVIVVQGVEIAKPAWFKEPDLEQLTAQMGRRRNR